MKCIEKNSIGDTVFKRLYQNSKNTIM